jgi:hypothetical protein
MERGSSVKTFRLSFAIAFALVSLFVTWLLMTVPHYIIIPCIMLPFPMFENAKFHS